MRRWLPLLLLSGCAVSHGVKPLPQGQGALTASLGGPISKDLPTPVPFVVPITTVGYAHGATDLLTVHGSIHPSGLAAFGVFAADIGAAQQLLAPSGAAPRLMIDGTLILATGNNAPGDPAGGTRLFPDIQLVASWDLGKHAAYVGVDQFFQPFPTVRYHVSPLFGALLSAGRTDLQIEYMWQAPYQRNDLLTAEFVGPFGQGASAIKVGLAVHFGKRDDTPEEASE